MKQILRIGALAFLVGFAGCGKSDTKKTTDINSNSSGNPITAPVDYLGAVAKAKKTAVKVIDKASLDQTIQLFHEQEDRYPATLDELVSKHFIGALPQPPYNMRYTYDPKTGKVGVVPK